MAEVAMIYWEIYIDGEYIDTVGLSAGYNEDQVCRKLVRDGWSRKIRAHLYEKKEEDIRPPKKEKRTAMQAAFEKAN